MTNLTRETILAKQDRIMKKVNVPAWDGDVYIKQLSGAEQDRFEQDSFMATDKSIIGVRARLISLALCNEDGSKMFTIDDIPALQDKNSVVLNMLYEEITATNRITDNDIEGLAKNSCPVQLDV